ncbi:hypothetical protein R6Q59_011691 [Mikania micrantha]|uniref:DUF7054 domain-containing protein n=1 Tax=Mikania micrantha TaxID=192012 RepID=A0A5N6LKJ2_9ASTR|nr:hypothetical protein E3N88_41536 [Mikania micrantha]KAD4384288.1 hypothetical protein E3N88_24456 [Mikania micrantha]
MKKSSPKGPVKNKKERLPEKSMSFNGRVSEDMAGKLTRPRTVPNLISGRSVVVTEPMRLPKLTKLLIKVTIQRSLGPVHVLISPESTVGGLIAAALRQYSKEGRRPVFPSIDPSGFDLHYSQFSLQSLSPDATLKELGSRNFFVCPKQSAHGETGGMTGSSASTCSKEATNGGAVWLKFMEFML